MSWELTEFELEGTGPVQVFNFEARFKHNEPGQIAHEAEGSAAAAAAVSAAPEELTYRGDGIYMTRSKQVRLNREAELAELLRERFTPPVPAWSRKRDSYDPRPVVAELAAVIRERLTARQAAAPQRRAERMQASATPAVGSVAYMLRWDQLF